MHIVISPVLLGAGERLFENIDLPALGYACVRHVASPHAMHLVLGRAQVEGRRDLGVERVERIEVERVGEHGELEHIAAVLHPKFGAPTRGRVGGVSILPSVKKRAAMGATLDIPVHHIKAMLVRSHFDAVEIRVPDAPGADELLLALAVTNGGRPFARVGGLLAADAIGEDGLH